MKVVRPWQSRFNDNWICCSVLVSTALVASSKRTMSGLLRIALAMATRCSSPPESLLEKLTSSCSVREEQGRLTRLSLLLWCHNLFKSQTCPLIAADRQPTMSELCDLIMYASRSTGFKYFFIASSNSSIPHIVHYSIVKQNWTLRDDADSISQAEFASVRVAREFGRSWTKAYLNISTSRISWPSIVILPSVTS